MDADAFFADNYRTARDKFISACRALRLLPQAHLATAGPGETELPLVDSVRLGDPAARRMLVVCGGDRQVDALCCSAIEVGWLNEFANASLPHDTAILLLNHGPAPPAGGEAPPRGGPPPEWEDDLLAKVEKRYAEYARRKGVDSLGKPVAVPEMHSIPGYPAAVLDSVAKWLHSAADGRIAFVDVRIGLGPYGEVEITPCHPSDTAATRRVRSWFGMADQPPENAPAAQEPDSLAAGLIRRLPEAEITAFSATFGTYSMMSVLDSLTTRPEGEAIPDPRQLLCPSDEAWRNAVWRSAIIVIQRALTALHAS
ncbi:MAG: M14 family metallopeptidase [Alphaproteobacteria bacterium]|nr:M14 family metallopeptidase [Alphaproteobacteria bacterium]